MRQSFESETCNNCGEEVDSQDPRNYWPSASGSVVLCYQCATGHGGVYDSRAETWSRPPRRDSLEHQLPEDKY